MTATVRVYAYRHRDEPYTVENDDISPLEPFTIAAGVGLTVVARADTAVGPKCVAVRIEREATTDELTERLTKRLAYPFVKAELPTPPTEEVSRRLESDPDGAIALLDAHHDRALARTRQYQEAIRPRLADAVAVA